MKFTFNVLRNSDNTNHTLIYEIHQTEDMRYHNFEEYFAIAIGNLIVDAIESDQSNTGTFNSICREPQDLYDILQESYIDVDPLKDHTRDNCVEALIDIIPDMWTMIMEAYNMDFRLLSYNVDFEDKNKSLV